jgi:hypothetical protein
MSLPIFNVRFAAQKLIALSLFFNLKYTLLAYFVDFCLVFSIPIHFIYIDRSPKIITLNTRGRTDYLFVINTLQEKKMTILKPETLLGREQGARALTEAGYPTSPATLSTKASRGGGPIYRRFGNRALYISWPGRKARPAPRVAAPAKLKVGVRARTSRKLKGWPDESSNQAPHPRCQPGSGGK